MWVAKRVRPRVAVVRSSAAAASAESEKIVESGVLSLAGLFGRIGDASLMSPRFAAGSGFRGASDRLVELGFEAAMLWVVKGNARARRFYEREGWTPDGTEKRHRFGDQLVPELRYGATLAGALSG
jgi:hypothetical protein